MKIVIFGAGGVGGFFGACLTRAGLDVTFVARGAHLDALRTRIKGDFNGSLTNADSFIVKSILGVSAEIAQ